MNENTKTIQDLAAYVCDRLAGKVLIHRYDAYSTNSVYLKFDYGVANSLRIADHAGKEYLSYRFNIILTLTEPKNALMKQYQALLDMDGVKLEFTEDALKEIAHMAVERKTGARGLRSIMEAIMMDVMYEIPSDSTIGICTITKDVVDGASEPELVYRDNTVPRKSFTGRMKKDKTGEIA